MRIVLLATLLLLPIPTASEALELCAKADLRGPDPTAPRNNSPIKLREQCKSPKEVSIGSTADLAKVQANEAAIANKADQSEVDANTAAIGLNATAIAEKADQSAVDANSVAISGKADRTSLDALASVVGANSSDISSNSADIEAQFARIGILEQAHPDIYPCLSGAEWDIPSDGTVTQCSTGLMWEMKTDDGTIHDVDNTYTWSGPSYFTTSEFDGTAKTDFLDVLNTPPCFAGHCDWRLPTIEELSGRSDCGAESSCLAGGGIIDIPECSPGFSTPCTTIPGETRSSYHWSSSSDDAPSSAWVAYFHSGWIGDFAKYADGYVRAVRGGTCVSDQWYTCP